MSSLRLSFSVLLLILVVVQCYGQDDRNRKPKIHGQRELSVYEEQSITIYLTDLSVEDDTDWLYPYGYSLYVLPGDHYTFSGTTVIPEKDFTGELKVKVVVSDGEKESDPFDLKITVIPVNDAPVITGQQPLAVTNTSSIALQLANLIVSDPDNDFPKDFQLFVYNGNNYTASGNTITPASGFVGDLIVPVRVSDGQAESDQYNLRIAVSQGISKPIITGQQRIAIDEDQPFTIEFSHLEVTDFDDNYPDGFTMHLYNGNNYSFNERTVTPARDFTGDLVVSVSVNDGSSESNVYGLTITVRPVNDPPTITFEPDTVVSRRPSDPVSAFAGVNIYDPDDAEVMMAEIHFVSEFQPLYDQLTFTPTENIRGAFDSQQGILTLIGKASIEEYESIISSITLRFTEMPDPPAIERKAISATASDGDATGPGSLLKVFITEDGELPPPSTANVIIPTGFTPNGDMVNDTWRITPNVSGELFAGAVVRVYSKTGLLVFEGKGFDKEWDGVFNGSVLPPDVYFFTIDFNTADPTQLLKGIVTILR